MNTKRSFFISSASFINMLLILILYYYSYRYIFKYANDRTSGTYFNTPLAVQAAKYLICMLILVLFSLYGISRKHCCTERCNIVLGLWGLLIHAVYVFILLRNKDAMILVMGLAIMVCIITMTGRINYYKIDRIFFIFFIYCTCYEIIQLVLYFTKGRLPAIAWGNAGIFYVRFGGAFDEPFAFSLFLSFLIPYIYNKYHGFRKYMLTVMLLFFLLMTWTITTCASVIGILGLSAIIRLSKNKVKSKEAFFVILGIGLSGVWGLFYGIDFFRRLLIAKAGSIAGHLASFDFTNIKISNILGIIPQAKYSESSIIKMLYSNGFIFVLLFYLTGIIVLIRFKKHVIKTTEDSHPLIPLYKGMYYFQICFLVSSLNIPYTYAFFSMCLYSVFLGIMLVSEKEYRRM